jgi:hypothetical protein
MGWIGRPAAEWGLMGGSSFMFVKGLQAAGKTSLRAIAAGLNDAGIPSGKWFLTTRWPPRLTLTYDKIKRRSEEQIRARAELNELLNTRVRRCGKIGDNDDETHDQWRREIV